MEIIAHIARRVRSERQRRGWSQEELASRAGLSRTYISYVEIARRNPTLKALDQLAQAFQVEVADLLTIKRKPTARKRKVGSPRP